MEIRYQIIILGAGPAGLNAAKYAANAGLTVGLIDAAPKMGGQYWRHTGDEKLDSSTHHDFDKGSLLMDAVKANPRITIHSGATIWSASVIDGEVVLRASDRSFLASRLILATGGYDRSLPFPGWDIPGVITAGAAQSLLKGQGVLVGKKIVIAGSGPFLLPVAAGLSSHGGSVLGVFEASGKYSWIHGIGTLMQNPAKILEGLGYLLTLRKNKVELRFNEAVTAAHAGPDGLLASVTISKIDSGFKVISSYELKCDVAAISWGFTPDTSLAGLLNLRQKVAADGSVIVEVDGEQRTTHPHLGVDIFAAGELTGIGGSDLALAEGAIAGLAAAKSNQGLKKLKQFRKKAERFARALEKVYPTPRGWRSWLTEETIICRCEEVTYHTLQEAEKDLEVRDARSAKLMARCGMGMCQGRICSRNIFDLFNSDEKDRVNGSYRPIISPITLGEVAAEGLL